MAYTTYWMNNRVAWLVDLAYVVKASDGRFKLDYVSAEAYLKEKCGDIRTFLFNGFDPAYGIPSGLQAFYDAMRLQGMVVRLHTMQSGPPGTNRQRRVDVDFCAHLVWQACLEHVQTLVLTTGDQDFVPAVELVREQFDKHIVLFTYDSPVHHDLIACVNEWWHFESEAGRLSWR